MLGISRQIEAIELTRLTERIGCKSQEGHAGQDLVQSTRKLEKNLSRLEAFRVIVGLISFVLFASCVEVFFQYRKTPPLYFFLGLLIIGIFFFLGIFCLIMPRLIQFRTRFFTGQRYDAKIPYEAEQLLLDLATGKKEAYFPIRSTKGSFDCLRTQTGELLGAPISNRLFKSRFAPLLLVDKPSYWRHVLVNTCNPLSGVNQPIYVKMDSPISEDSNNQKLANNELIASVIRGGGQARIDSENRSIKADNDLDEHIVRHWRSAVPYDLREAFCKTYISLGKWTGEDATKISIALQAAFSCAGQLGTHNGNEKIGPLVKAAIAALNAALQKGEIETLWLSDAQKPDPTEGLSKILGNGKTHKYDKHRIETFKILGLSDNDVGKPPKQ